MREIKFRHWEPYEEPNYDGEIGCMEYNPPPYDSSYSLNEALAEYPKEGVLMQYTGLKDKNGKDIYEGDIVKLEKEAMESYGGDAEHCIVGWKDGGFMFGRNKDYPEEMNSYLWLVASEGWNKCEVIGNIHKNPELLEGTT